jgi:acyl-CoA synthetase (AMP-forming)/AMP-acid ligase II
MIFGDLDCLGEMITRNARVYPGQEGFVFEDVRLTWSQVNDRVNRLANAIRRLGIEPKERLALLGKNSHRYLEAFFAATKTGIVAVKMNYRYSEKELAYILNDCQARGIVFDGEFAGCVRTLSSSVPSLKYFICTDQKVEGALEYERLLETAPAAEPHRKIQGDDLVMIQYTSGTTGKSKGAMMTHRGQILLANNGALGLSRARMMIPLPLFAAAATGRTLSHVYLGNSIIIVRDFEPRSFVETIEKERIAWTGFVPSMFYILKEKVPDIRKYNLSSMRRIIYGAAPMTVSQLLVAMDIFKGCEFEGGYGLTETGPYGCRLLPEEHRVEGPEKEVKRLASVGRMGINGRVKIVDKNRESLPPGQIGEIALLCDSNMVGYWNKPGETAEALDGDGWVYTGDMGEMDEDGFVFIRDRKKDMIISGGFNIYPKEIEDVLMTHPAVMESAVIGIPDERWGEAILALVMLKQGQKTTEQELIEHCRRQVASFKKPKRIEFVQDFPRTPLQKIKKNELREKHWAATGRRM